MGTVATKDDLAKVNNDSTRISENKAEMIKRMFIFWIGQIGATLAIVTLYLKN